MKTKTLTISANALYESKVMHKVRDLASGQDYLLTKWGTFRITSADNRFICGERVKREASHA